MSGAGPAVIFGALDEQLLLACQAKLAHDSRERRLVMEVWPSRLCRYGVTAFAWLANRGVNDPV